MMNNLAFYKGKRVLITGHTGFKGSWMCAVLSILGAEVAGYALNLPTNPNLFSIVNEIDLLSGKITNYVGDISDILKQV